MLFYIVAKYRSQSNIVYHYRIYISLNAILILLYTVDQWESLISKLLSFSCEINLFFNAIMRDRM